MRHSKSNTLETVWKPKSRRAFWITEKSMALRSYRFPYPIIIIWFISRTPCSWSTGGSHAGTCWTTPDSDDNDSLWVLLCTSTRDVQARQNAEVYINFLTCFIPGWVQWVRNGSVQAKSAWAVCLWNRCRSSHLQWWRKSLSLHLS